MATLKVGTDQAQLAFYPMEKSSAKPGSQPGTGSTITPLKQDLPAPASVSTSRRAFGALQAVNASLNLVAENVKVADRAMGSIASLIGVMKEDLQGIVKNFPPFPPGSQERAEYLRSFSALRKQIEQLTFPPQHDGASKIMADSAVTGENGDWQVPVATGEPLTIRREEVHVGPRGLNIPDLPGSASDAEIAAALKKLESAAATLAERRAGLAADAAGVLTAIPKSKYDSGTVGAEASVIQPERAAELKSLNVRQALSQQPLSGITGMQTQLIQLLR